VKSAEKSEARKKVVGKNQETVPRPWTWCHRARKTKTLYKVVIHFAFRIAFLNLSARVFFRVDIVGGIDDGSAAVFIVISGSKERLYWEGSGKGMEIIGGVIVEPEGFELTA